MAGRDYKGQAQPVQLEQTQPSKEPVGIFYYPAKVSFQLITRADFALQDRLTREAIEKDKDIILHPERHADRFIGEDELVEILSAKPSPGDE